MTTKAMNTDASDKVRQLHDRLTAQLEVLVTSRQWSDYLTVAARFHHYSATNVALILAQRPDATRVAGYRTWAKLGRQVRRGEKGIAIFAPCVYRHRPSDDAGCDDRPELVKVLRGFTVAYVFDQAQTDGEPLADVRPVLFQGDDGHGLWDALAAQVAAAGFTLDRRSCMPANGSTNFATKTVVVDPGLAPSQSAKTLCHELAHVLLHDASRVRGDRELAEVEAESVAYVVCNAAGLTTGDYSLAYVARWSGGDLELVRRTTERVVTTAHSIIVAMDHAEQVGRLAEVAP